MAQNRLSEILLMEGIKQSELAAAAGISAATVGRVYRKSRSVSPTMQSKLVKGINKLADKSYAVEHVFPN